MFKMSFFLIITLFLSFALWTGCSSKEKSPDTAEGAYEFGQKLEKAEKIEEAIQQYTDVKNKHPYSRFAPLAELAIADLHYKQESYPEAQGAYQTFKEFHPKHERIDYVTFRLGMSYFNQLPSTIDRDLTVANNAISSFDEVLSKYPSSQYVAESKTKREEALKMLGERELYIADFYFKQEQYDSALGRYESTLKKYEKLGFEPRALKGASVSAFRLGDMEKSRQYLARLKAEYASDPLTSETEKETVK